MHCFRCYHRNHGIRHLFLCSSSGFDLCFAILLQVSGNLLSLTAFLINQAISVRLVLLFRLVSAEFCLLFCGVLGGGYKVVLPQERTSYENFYKNHTWKTFIFSPFSSTTASISPSPDLSFSFQNFWVNLGSREVGIKLKISSV